jgi:hypothetical protein
MSKSAREKLREKLREKSQESAQINQNTGLLTGNGVDFFYPKGKESYELDIVVYKAGKNSPVKKDGRPFNEEDEETYYMPFVKHKNIGSDKRGECICLAGTYRARCPICEHRAELLANDGDEDLINTLKQKLTAVYNIRLVGEDKVKVWEVSNWWSEKEFQDLKNDASYKRKWGCSEVLYMDPDIGKTIVFTQGENNQVEMGKLKGIRFEERENPVTDEDISNAACLEDLLTNNLPKNKDGSIDFDAAYKKVYSYYYAEPFDDEEAEKPVNEQKEEDSEEEMPWDKDEDKKKKKAERKRKKAEVASKKLKKDKEGDPSDVDWDEYDEDKDGLIEKLNEYPDLKKKVEKAIEEDDEDDDMDSLDPDDIVFYINEIIG